MEGVLVAHGAQHQVRGGLDTHLVGEGTELLEPALILGRRDLMLRFNLYLLEHLRCVLTTRVILGEFLLLYEAL